MEAEIFNAIKDRISSQMDDFKFMRIWNNQLESLRSKDVEAGSSGNKYSGIDYPALFVEFTPPTDILQLGNGVQLYDPLDIRIHIVHREEDAGDGTMEQNVNVFALKQKVYVALQNFEPDGCCSFSRTLEEQDYDHDNLYHYVQTYRTNYVDNDATQPVNGEYIDPPVDGSIDLDLTTEIDTTI